MDARRGACAVETEPSASRPVFLLFIGTPPARGSSLPPVLVENIRPGCFGRKCSYLQRYFASEKGAMEFYPAKSSLPVDPLRSAIGAGHVPCPPNRLPLSLAECMPFVAKNNPLSSSRLVAVGCPASGFQAIKSLFSRRKSFSTGQQMLEF